MPLGSDLAGEGPGKECDPPQGFLTGVAWCLGEEQLGVEEAEKEYEETLIRPHLHTKVPFLLDWRGLPQILSRPRGFTLKLNPDIPISPQETKIALFPEAPTEFTSLAVTLMVPRWLLRLPGGILGYSSYIP